MITVDLELQLRRDIFLASYYHFFVWGFKILYPNEIYEDNFHVKYLCDRYQREILRIIAKEEKDKDIIVNIPPRTSKSLITSVMLNAWAWIKDPTLPFISISFDEDLTLLNAQACKDLIKCDEYQALFGDIFQIRRDVDSKSFFQNDKGGFRLSKTTGSNITGHKGVVIIVDDPQNPKTAESETFRKDTIYYYTNSLYNRLTPINLGIRIIIMQRLHELDLTGYLLKEDPLGNKYEHICLPAEASDKISPPELVEKYTETHHINEKTQLPIKLLDPVRLTMKTLDGFKSTFGSRGYAGQYAQVPAEEGGSIIKAIWLEEVDPSILVRDPIKEPIHFVIDSAYTEKTENDPSSILAFYVSYGTMYILNCVSVKLEFPKLIDYILNFVRQHGYSDRSRICVEPKASGKSIVQQIKAQTKLNIQELPPPDGDKVQRAYAVTPTMESRRVKLIKGAYTKDYKDQLTTFPNAAHDDMVDVTTAAITEFLIGSDSPDIIWIHG